MQGSFGPSRACVKFPWPDWANVAKRSRIKVFIRLVNRCQGGLLAWMGDVVTSCRGGREVDDPCILRYAPETVFTAIVCQKLG